MFTGLVQGACLVEKVVPSNDQSMMRIFVENNLDLEYVFGDSIAVNGCCLTVVEDSTAKSIIFEVSRESLDKTNLGGLAPGRKVNLEQAMQLQDRLDGHLVSGHVDTTGQVLLFEEDPTGWLLKVSVDRRYGKYLIPKGSVCLDGVSLTVNELQDTAESTTLSMMIIPTTLEKTHFLNLKAGDSLNIEFDLVGKYILRSQSMGSVP